MAAFGITGALIDALIARGVLTNTEGRSIFQNAQENIRYRGLALSGTMRSASSRNLPRAMP